MTFSTSWTTIKSSKSKLFRVLRHQIASNNKKTEEKNETLFQMDFSALDRCEHLLARNEQLRQQLEESHRTNLALTTDLHKLTIDWEHMRDEIAQKEDEWKEEEQVSGGAHRRPITPTIRTHFHCQFFRPLWRVAVWRCGARIGFQRLLQLRAESAD